MNLIPRDWRDARVEHRGSLHWMHPGFLVSLCLGMLGMFPLPGHAWKMEAANITLPNSGTAATFYAVAFRQTYDSPPLVFTLTDSAGYQSGALRIRNVTTTGFEIIQVEPDPVDGAHAAMTVPYLAVDKGTHILPDGSLLEAGSVITSLYQDGGGTSTGWEPVSFPKTFSSAPTLLASIQTMNNEVNDPWAAPSTPWLTAAMRSISTLGMDLALDRSEVTTGSVGSSETLGWLALPSGLTGSFVDNGSSTVSYESISTAASVGGWYDTWTTVGFVGSYASAPLVLATKNSRNEADGGWLRKDNLTPSGIDLAVDEDTYADSERSHAGESAGLLVFSTEFDAEFTSNVVVSMTSQVIEDPFNSTVNPKRIPGSIVEYTVTVENQGYDYADKDSTVITFDVPTDTSFVVTDIAGPGSGPVAFADGAASSGMSWSFISLADDTDSVDFYDGASAAVDPVADTIGVDSSVRSLRLAPQGLLAASSSGNPGMSFSFRVRVN
ncbi:MAG: hypothetical protein ACWA5X_12465 [bacterium]